MVHDDEADLYHYAQASHHQLTHSQPVWLNMNRYSFRDINLQTKCLNLECGQGSAKAQSWAESGRSLGGARAESGRSQGGVGVESGHSLGGVWAESGWSHSGDKLL